MSDVYDMPAIIKKAHEMNRLTMVCVHGCDTEWSGRSSELCFICGRPGLLKHPNPKPEDEHRQWAGSRGEES